MAQTAVDKQTSPDWHKDGSNVFNANTFDENYWTNYLEARPKYSPEFYELIYAYHDAHNDPKTSYTLAHDVGTGPGQVLGEIAKRISHVVGSDANPSHIDVAAHRLAELHTSGRVSFVEAMGEEVAQKSTEHHGKVDFVFGGESFALMDTDRASASFATLLKPKGTLALWYYGRPIFVDAPECQKIYNRIATTVFRPTVSGGNEASRTMWKRSTEIMASWLDNIAFPTQQWENVERRKWNPSFPMEFFEDSACDYPIERSSLVTPGEKVIKQEDLSFWEENWDLKDVHRFLMANVPSFRNEKLKQEIEEGWVELGKAMGGKDKKMKISWPVVLVLATRK